MREEDFADFDEEEFEMLINGLIHPQDMFVSPDLMGGYPAPFGMPGMGAPGAVPGAGLAGTGGIDAMIAEAYDEEEGAF